MLGIEPLPFVPATWMMRYARSGDPIRRNRLAVRFNPSAATVLNVTQDHLDWHGSMAAYAAAKARIFGTAAMPDTVMVINRDDPGVEAMIPPPVTIKPTRRGERAKLVSRRGM